MLGIISERCTSLNHDRCYNFAMSQGIDLEKRIKKLEHQNQDMAEFISMLAHQLRTPLSGIKWTFKMLLDGDLGSFTKEQQDIIREGFHNNERLITLLEEVVEANRTAHWDFHYSLEPIDIEKFLADLITEFLEEAHAHEVHIIFKHPEQTLPKIQADREKLHTVIENLLENAIRYNQEGGTITIEPSLKPENIKEGCGEIEVHIHNTGIGIPEKEQEKIFTKFFRATNAKRVRREGTGLGLFTAKKIIEHHGGHIWFTSKEYEGATFSFCLPTTKDDQP